MQISYLAIRTYNVFKLVLAGLATWRLSRLLVQEEGPFLVLRKLRLATGIEYDDYENASMWPTWNPLHCMACTSIYAALAMLVMPERVKQVLAVSGIAMLLEDFTNG